MNTYLLTWNPIKWAWSTIETDIEKWNETGVLKDSWSCGVNKSIKVGDRIFLIRIGEAPKGIVASGYATSKTFEAKHWNGENSKLAKYIEIDFDILLNPNKQPILELSELQRGNLAIQNWTPQSSGISIKTEIVDELETVWFNFINQNNYFESTFFGNDIENKGLLIEEGSVKQITLNRYERNPHSRKLCIEHHGLDCKVCEFNFEKIYGSLGKNFIHVHHKNPISKIGKKYELNPITDLVPLCPNCHAMVHKRNPILSVEELKTLIKAAQPNYNL